MTDASLAARLRDVLHLNGVQDSVTQDAVMAALLPLLLSLQEEQRREIQEVLEPLTKQLIDWRTDDDADGMDTTDMVCEVGDGLTALLSRLASSSSASARREEM